jgi:hypothetical protein
MDKHLHFEKIIKPRLKESNETWTFGSTGDREREAISVRSVGPCSLLCNNEIPNAWETISHMVEDITLYGVGWKDRM